MERHPIRRLAVACLAVVLTGCFALSPRLDPYDPEPTPRLGAELVTVPDEHVASWTMPFVVEVRDAYLEREPPLDPLLVESIQLHRVLVGMSVDEVVYALESHPARIRRQGPPGGETYCWEPHRYWVRFNREGVAVAAGRH